MTGRPPAQESERRNRAPLLHDWQDVLDVPFRAAPGIGHRPGGEAWPDATKRWWVALGAMPHCATWRPPAWEYMRTTALLHAEIVEGATAKAGELRIREAAMGTTDDALRALRIRYVPKVGADPVVVESDEVQARRDARRQRIIDGEVG
ncbi:MAG: hypothetical protein M3Q30_15300 [Actinomycetota bacterium]|nr:hypothetical protein [Actinomycetota bacterium]